MRGRRHQEHEHIAKAAAKQGDRIGGPAKAPDRENKEARVDDVRGGEAKPDAAAIIQKQAAPSARPERPVGLGREAPDLGRIHGDPALSNDALALQLPLQE